MRGVPGRAAVRHVVQVTQGGSHSLLKTDIEEEAPEEGSVAEVTANLPKPKQLSRSLFFESDSRASAAV